jgi:hypothetical protein
MEESTSPIREVVRLTHTWEVVLLDGVHHVPRVRVHPAVAVRTAGELPAFGHAPESRPGLRPFDDWLVNEIGSNVQVAERQTVAWASVPE